MSLVLAIVSGPLMYNEMHLEFENQIPSWSFVLALLGFGVIGVLFTLAIQVANPWAAGKWVKPSWRENPFNVSQPIQSFHLGGWFLTIAGISAALYTLEIGARNFMFVLPLTLGLGSALGVKLAVLAFRGKFEEQGNAA